VNDPRGMSRSENSPRIILLQRIIIVVTLLIGGFFLAVFQASLTAALSATDVESEFRSIENVKSCKIAADRICLVDGTAAATFWEESIVPSLKAAACEAIVSKRLQSTTGGFKAVDSSSGCEFFLAASAEALWYVTGEYCNKLSLVGAPFYSIERSFVLPKGSPLTSSMTRETLRLRETGQIQSGSDYTKSHLQECPAGAPNVKMTWEKLAWFFVLTWMVLLLLLALRMASCTSRKRRPQAANEGMVITELVR
jgi:hypothetical protein